MESRSGAESGTDPCLPLAPQGLASGGCAQQPLICPGPIEPCWCPVCLVLGKDTSLLTWDLVLCVHCRDTKYRKKKNLKQILLPPGDSLHLTLKLASLCSGTLAPQGQLSAAPLPVGMGMFPGCVMLPEPLQRERGVSAGVSTGRCPPLVLVFSEEDLCRVDRRRVVPRFSPCFLWEGWCG